MSDQANKRGIDDGLRQAIAKAGSANALAFALGMSAQALYEWRRVPAHRILQVEAVTGIRREKLRPELYRARSNKQTKTGGAKVAIPPK